MAAAVGSLMSVSTCRPAAPAHSLVAWRASPLELAGMVTTALVNGLVELLLGVRLEQAEEHDGDLLGAQVLADQRHALGSAEDALDGANGALLVEVFLGFLAEGQAAVAAQGDDGGRPLLALVVGNDLRLTVMKVGHDRVAGAEIDADVLHICLPLSDGPWPKTPLDGNHR